MNLYNNLGKRIITADPNSYIAQCGDPRGCHRSTREEHGVTAEIVLLSPECHAPPAPPLSPSGQIETGLCIGLNSLHVSHVGRDCALYTLSLSLRKWLQATLALSIFTLVAFSGIPVGPYRTWVMPWDSSYSWIFIKRLSLILYTATCWLA